MRNILELLLLTSVTGSILGLAVILLRKLLRGRTDPSFWYYLWVLVALRLLLPLEAPIAAVTIPTAPSSTAADASPALSSRRLPDIIEPGDAAYAGQAQEETAPSSPAGQPVEVKSALPMPEMTTILFVMWAAVALARLLAGVIGTIRFTRAARRAAIDTAGSADLQRLASEAAARVGLPRTPAVHVLQGVDTALQMGFIKPMVVVPHLEMTEDGLRYILLHEFVHCRRRDILYKWLVQLFVCVHWFNPLVYLFRREIAEDCELSCDGQVLRLLGEGERRAYGDMLLTSIAPKRPRQLPAGSAMLSQDARTLRSRLAQIAGYGKGAKPLAAVSVITVAALLACGFVAGPARGKQPPQEQTGQGDTGNFARNLSNEAQAPPQIPYRSPVQEKFGLNDPKDIAEDFAVYQPFGLTHNLAYNRLYYHGELVRYFEDIESETSYKRWAMPDGTVDVYAQRDGAGKLTGVAKYPQEAFDARTESIDDYPHAYTHSVTNSVYQYRDVELDRRDLNTPTVPAPGDLGERLPGETDGEYYGRVYGQYYGQLYGSSGPPQSLKDTLTKTYREYGPFGLTYDPDTHRLYYEGKLVKFFSDQPGGGGGTSNNRSFGPYEDGEVTVTARRGPDGALTGLVVKVVGQGDGGDMDRQNPASQGTDQSLSPQTAAVGSNRGFMTEALPIGGAGNIEIIAPTCQLVIEKSSGNTVEAVFTYPRELEPNYTKYVQLVVEQPDAETIRVETKYDDHGFDLISGMDIEEQMGYQPVLTVKIPDRQYRSLTIRLTASARDDVWDLPLDIRAQNLTIRSVANNVRFILGAVYDSVHIENYAGECYLITPGIGGELSIENKAASFYLTLLQEPDNIDFDLSQVDAAQIPAQWKKALTGDSYRKGAGTAKGRVSNDRGTVSIHVQQ